MSKLDIVTIANAFKPGAYLPGSTPAGLALAQHRFSAAPDGQLEHHIGEKHVATIPPEGMADYAALWPECAALVKSLAPGVKVKAAPAKTKRRR